MLYISELLLPRVTHSILHVMFTGQYSGKSEPLPEYHVKIAGFDEKVCDLSHFDQFMRGLVTDIRRLYVQVYHVHVVYIVCVGAYNEFHT